MFSQPSEVIASALRTAYAEIWNNAIPIEPASATNGSDNSSDVTVESADVDVDVDL